MKKTHEKAVAVGNFCNIA